MRSQSISVHFARALLANCVRMGVDPTALLRQNRISPRLLREDGPATVDELEVTTRPRRAAVVPRRIFIAFAAPIA